MDSPARDQLAAVIPLRRPRSDAVLCDYPGCDTPSIGYGDRQLQGPFYCARHEGWAEAVVKNYYMEVWGDGPGS
jgi:hypothetical protein